VVGEGALNPAHSLAGSIRSGLRAAFRTPRNAVALALPEQDAERALKWARTDAGAVTPSGTITACLKATMGASLRNPATQKTVARLGSMGPTGPVLGRGQAIGRHNG
jgi:hypothetical protein